MTGCQSDLDRLMATLTIKLPGVDEDALKLELFNTIDDFFRKTNAWREILDAPLAEDTTEYPITAPSNTAMVRVLEATLKGGVVSQQVGGVTAVGQQGRLVADEMFMDGDAVYNPDIVVDQTPSNSLRYAVYYPNYISIDVPPSDDVIGQPLKIVAALTLSPSALKCDCGDWSMPEWMWERYFHDFLHGTLANCMSEGAKPYTNAKLAVYHAAEFRRAKSFARQEAQRGFVFDRPMWRFPVMGGWIR